MYYLLFSILLLSFFSPSSFSQSAPWVEHGKLEASKNGRYIQHTDGTPFLWIGDTAWGMFQQLTREEVDLYLDNRKNLGFSVIQAVAHWSPHGGGFERSPDNAPNAYGHKPFEGDENSPNTASPLLVEGGSPDSPNDYWDHVDYVIDAVQKRNMYLALLPCWASELVTNKKEYSPQEAKAYGKFLGRRYRNTNNIIWVLGGDTKAHFKGYDKYQKYYDYDFRDVYRAMAEGIAQGVTGKKASWKKKSRIWDDIFFTYHPNGDYPYGSAQWFHSDAWLDANGIEAWKQVEDVYRTMLDHYQLENPIKPAIFLEGSYEYGAYRHECGWVTPLAVRRQMYQTFFAGGAGHTYGAAPIWAMRGNSGDYNCGYTWKQALDFPGATQVATLAKKVLSDFYWFNWKPNGKLISGFSRGSSLKVAVSDNRKNLGLIYFSDNSHIQVNNIFLTKAEAYWIDPRNGIATSSVTLPKDQSRDMAPPEKWEDAILVIQGI